MEAQEQREEQARPEEPSNPGAQTRGAARAVGFGRLPRVGEKTRPDLDVAILHSGEARVQRRERRRSEPRGCW